MKILSKTGFQMLFLMASAMKITAEETTKIPTKEITQKTMISKDNQVTTFPPGYFTVPGLNTGILIGGRLKADLAYYPRNNADSGNVSYDATIIPIKNVDNSAQKSGYTSGTIACSRLDFRTITPSEQNDFKSWIQLDFNGYKSNSSSTSYGVRVRHAIVEWGALTAGQTLTNFHDIDEGPEYTLDNNGLTNWLRRLQIKYTKKVNDGVTFSAAAEQPNTDFVNQFGSLGNTSTNGKSGMPDLTARLRFDGKLGFISFRGIARRLEVNVVTGDTITGAASGTSALTTFSSKRTGWGLGSSFKLFTVNKNNIYGQVNFGTGINDFLVIETVPSAYLQIPTTASNSNRFAARFDLNSGTSAILGYEQWWTDKIRSNLACSLAYLHNSKFSPVLASTQINSTLKKVLFNTLYSPIEKVIIGIELIYGTRETISGRDTSNGTTYFTYPGGKGAATQVMTSFMYKF